MSKHSKISSHFSSNKSSKGQKRVVSVRLKDDHHTNKSPPSDSWAWRKYGQKPIKGSPYPRGYYKCSTAKGCPARKQVERSKMDPHILLVTYSSDHNHPCPEYSKNNHRRPTITATSVSEDEEEEKEENKLISNDNDHNTDNVEGSQMVSCAGEFEYFSDLESTSCAANLDRCPILSDRGNISADAEMATIFTRIVEGDESLIFSGLGELPECAAVLRWSDATSGRVQSKS